MNVTQTVAQQEYDKAQRAAYYWDFRVGELREQLAMAEQSFGDAIRRCHEAQQACMIAHD